MPAFQQALLLTNAPSPPPSQLLSPPISLHQSWLLPLQTCPSMHLFPHSPPFFAAHSSLCLSQSISLSEKQTGATRLTPAGVEAVGGSTTLKHFARQLLVKETTDSIVEHQVQNRPTSDLLDTQDKSKSTPLLHFYQKDSFCIIMCQQCERKGFLSKTWILVYILICCITEISAV